MRAEIISTGTELLLGEIVNSNASFIAAQLPSLGIDIYYMATVGDNRERIIEVISQAWQRSDIIITTGGLGPTQGDITRDAIAEFFHEDITIDPALAQHLKDRFRKYNMEMPPNNLKQAGLIPSAQSLPNARGTAPGWWIEKDNHILITLPGPTSEVEGMWYKEVLPRLEKKAGTNIIVTRTIKTFGLSEADVDQRVSKFMSSPNPTLAIYARTDGIQLRIAAKAETRESAQYLVTSRESEIRQLLDSYIWGTDSETIDTILGNMVAAEGLTLATMETETGGLMAQTMTGLRNSQKFYRGGTVIYSGNIGETVHAPFSAIPDTLNNEAAVNMAVHIRKTMNSDIGIGITGVPGPNDIGNTKVGTIFVGIDYRGKTAANSRSFPGQPFQIKQRAITFALFELRKLLLIDRD
jgi:nicotinamide-nucleotide amidase